MKNSRKDMTFPAQGSRAADTLAREIAEHMLSQKGRTGIYRITVYRAGGRMDGFANAGTIENAWPIGSRALEVL